MVRGSNGDHADKGNGGEEDAPDEFGDGADNGGMDSKLWSMVDGA